jgi:hypothetical protein
MRGRDVDVRDLLGKCGNDCGRCALYKDNLTDESRPWCAQGMGRYINWHPRPEKLRQCAGCQATGGFLYIKNCRVRMCAQYNGIENCAHCSAFPCLDVPTVSVPVDYRDRVAQRLGSLIPEEDYLAFIEPYEGMEHLKQIRASLEPDDIVEMKEVSIKPRLVDFPQDLPLPEEEAGAFEALHRLLGTVEAVDSVSHARRAVLRERRRRLLRILWAFARFGEGAEEDGLHLVLESETYLAQKIESNYTRVQDYFQTLSRYGVQCEHVPLAEGGWLTPKGALRKGGWSLSMSFADSAGGTSALKALQRYAARLDEEYGRRAFGYFSRADMRTLIKEQFRS